MMSRHRLPENPCAMRLALCSNDAATWTSEAEMRARSTPKSLAFSQATRSIAAASKRSPGPQRGSSATLPGGLSVARRLAGDQGPEAHEHPCGAGSTSTSWSTGGGDFADAGPSGGEESTPSPPPLRARGASTSVGLAAFAG